MAQIDVDKFVCSFLSTSFDENEAETIRNMCDGNRRVFAPLRVVMMAINKALKAQGLRYKDGKLYTTETEED